MKVVLLFVIALMARSSRGLNFGPYYSSFLPGPTVQAPFHLPPPLPDAFPVPTGLLGFPGEPLPFGSHGIHGDAMMFGVPEPLVPPHIYGVYPMFGFYGRYRGPYGNMQPFGKVDRHSEHMPSPQKRKSGEHKHHDIDGSGKGYYDSRKVYDNLRPHEGKMDVGTPYQYDRYDYPVKKGRMEGRYPYDEHMQYTRKSENGGHNDQSQHENKLAFDKNGPYIQQESHRGNEITYESNYYDGQGLHDHQPKVDRPPQYQSKDPKVDGPPYHLYTDQYTDAHRPRMPEGSVPLHGRDYYMYAQQGFNDGPSMSDRTSYYRVGDPYMYHNERHSSAIGEHVGNVPRTH